MDIQKQKQQQQKRNGKNRDQDETVIQEQEHLIDVGQEQDDVVLCQSTESMDEVVVSIPLRRSAKIARSPPQIVTKKQDKPRKSIDLTETSKSCSPAALTIEPIANAACKIGQPVFSSSPTSSIISQVSSDSKRKRNTRNKEENKKEYEEDDSSGSYSSGDEQTRKMSKKFTPPDRKTMLRDKAARQELENMGIDELETAIQVNSRIIDSVVDKSSNLKGGCVKELREAAARIRAAGLLMYSLQNKKRKEKITGDSNDQEQIEMLYERIEILEKEKKKLESTVNNLNIQLKEKEKEVNELREGKINVSPIKAMNMKESDINRITREITTEIKNILPSIVQELVNL